MRDVFQFLVFTIIGVMLIWFSYTLFFLRGRARQEKKRGKAGRSPAVETGRPGDPKVCPVCAAKLGAGERVKSAAWPGIPGQGRLMHISGCVFCLDGSRDRKCPVCGAALLVDEVLVARIFDRPGRSHVHVLGCSHCREALAGAARRARGCA
ncbi:MAG: hypothetical protein LBC88_06375 [Spirochaetaceae bacterium]|nr:hypothetical protein [Spirochaetaceae bacterium]